MKRLSIILVALLVLLLSACQNDQSKSNVIFASELNDKENIILTTVSEQSFVFDYQIDTEYSEVIVWIEKYQSGELQDDKIGYISTEPAEDSGTIILSTSKPMSQEEQQTYYIGIGDEGKTASSSIVLDQKSNTDHFSMVSGQIVEEKALDDEKENVLATIAYSDNEYGVSSISSDFYEDPETHLDELKEYDEVYLFKAKFVE